MVKFYRCVTHSHSADWTGDDVPSGDAMRSTVVTSMPSTCTANIRHDRTVSSSWTATGAPAIAKLP